MQTTLGPCVVPLASVRDARGPTDLRHAPCAHRLRCADLRRPANRVAAVQPHVAPPSCPYHAHADDVTRVNRLAALEASI
jgi:hypothetical protein